MSDKPSYLGTLNAIAVGAARGQKLLTAWQRATPDAELAGVLGFLATREQEHAGAFAKRISELGYTTQERPSQKFTEHLELARSDVDDSQKFREILEFAAPPPADDPLLNIFADTSIDAQTGALLGRYIAEDRDSHRRLRAQYQRLTPAQPEPAPSDADESVLHDIATRLDRLTSTLEELRSLRR